MRQSKIIAAPQTGAPIYYHDNLQRAREEIQRSF
jgi:hypothetical protein